MGEAEVLDPPGSHAHPCTPADIEDKFRRLAGNVKSRDTVDRIVAAVRKLPSMSTVSELSAALREGNL